MLEYVEAADRTLGSRRIWCDVVCEECKLGPGIGTSVPDSELNHCVRYSHVGM